MIVTDQMRKAIRYGVLRRGPDECWPWRKHLCKGYGQFCAGKTQYLAHRVAYQIAYGDLQEHLLVLHTCDVPACCNPAHLFQGTHLDNVADCFSKHRRPTGAQMPNAKLTQLQVEEIRFKYALGISQQKLADEYGTSQQLISRCIRKVTYK